MMRTEPRQFRYDVFLSHSSKDADRARRLAERLRGDGLRVWFDGWEIKVGDDIYLKIEAGLEESRALVLFMSGNAFSTEWMKLERSTSLYRDPTNADRRFIPLLAEECSIPDVLGRYRYVDWRLESKEAYRELIEACLPGLIPEPVPSNEPGAVPPPCEEVVPCAPRAERVWFDGSHTDNVRAVAVLPDGRRAVSGSDDGTLKLWDIASGCCLATFEGHSDAVWSVAVLPDGERVISGSWDGMLRLWDIASGRCLAIFAGHNGPVMSVAVLPDGERAISGSTDCTLKLWDMVSGRCLATFEGHMNWVRRVAVLPDARRAISGSYDNTLKLWDSASGLCLATFEGHTNIVRSVVALPDGQRAISGSADGTLKLWDIASGRCLATFEGHTYSVYSVAVLPDGERAISGSMDGTLRMWNLATGAGVVLAKEMGPCCSLALVSGTHIVVGSDEGVALYRLDGLDAAAARPVEEQRTRYTNAKVVLAGDSGVGKTGLACRLTENCFSESISTDGAWATQLSLPHAAADDGMEREIWLWDFAGQADYRLIHQLYMDEASLAVLVFNPQSENPFEGLGQWDRDLQRAARRHFEKLLVAGRCDRGGLMVSDASIQRFRNERGFADYISTSALSGDGCDKLREAIARCIPWDTIPWTASTRTFKMLKDEILKIKDEMLKLKDEGSVLLRMGELKQQLEMRLPKESFTPEELRAVVGLLAGPGVVWQLEFGDFVLLQPERINAYAAAVIRSVRAHSEEIGCIAEEDVLKGKLDYQDMKRLPSVEEEIVLRAMYQTLVDHGLCLRERTDNGTLLVFPSYFKRERPVQDDHPHVLVTYRFNGMLDEIYATLVVRLYHTDMFENDQLWRFAADFRTPAGKRLGLKMTRKPEGAAELQVYFESDVPEDTQVTFIRYVHEHLTLKAQDVVRLRHYVCPHCHLPVEGRRAIDQRLEKGFKDIICSACEERVPLVDLVEEKFSSEEFKRRAREWEAKAKASIDNESKELILIGHAFAIAGEAGQIFRPTSNSDWGIDGEIEFKDYEGNACGQRLYLQLKSGDSHLYDRKRDEAQVFTIDNPRHATHWQQHAYPVMLVIRTADGVIRWMDVSEYLKRESEGGKKVKQIVFDGEPFTAASLLRWRDRYVPVGGA